MGGETAVPATSGGTAAGAASSVPFGGGFNAMLSSCRTLTRTCIAATTARTRTRAAAPFPSRWVVDGRFWLLCGGRFWDGGKRECCLVLPFAVVQPVSLVLWQPLAAE